MSDSPADAGGCGLPQPLIDTRPLPVGAARRGLLLTARGRWRPVNLIWLIWSAFFFIDPLQRNTLRGWLLFAGAYAAFLALYMLVITVRSGRLHAALLLALTALGTAYTPYNSSAFGMFTYVSALVPFLTDSLWLAAAVIATVTLITTAEGQLLHLPAAAWASMSLLTAFVGIGNLISALRIRATRRLDLAQDQIEHLAKVAERERIARDLHDVLGHTLSVVVLKSELAGKLMGSDAGRARQEIGEVEQIARQALAEVREAIRGYRTEGLAVEIARARRTLDAAGVSLDCAAEGVRVEPSHDTVLSLVLREAVTNILRHAGATRCRLGLTADDRRTVLWVEDNGRGAAGREGNGIRGMRERVEALGGRLEIQSSQGTRLTAEIPHAAAART